VKVKTGKIKAVLLWGKKYLSAAGVEPDEAEILLSEALEITRPELYINMDKELSGSNIERYRDYMIKRGKFYPCAYITGHAYFMGLKLKVSPHVLIPRPETELLAEHALKFIRNGHRVLEIGTGCANLAIALAKFSNAEVVSVEKSSQALEIARENIFMHRLRDRVKLIEGDMFEPVHGRFDCLISNPPYVKVSEYDSIQEEVKREPKPALLAGADGLRFIREIINRGPDYLKPGGKIFLEIGCGQSEEVSRIAARNRKISGFGFIKDYKGIDRIFAAE
jgi:release factor glutamine methyltransferase